MGYDVHHAILVTTFAKLRAIDAHVKAFEIFDHALVSPMSTAIVNDWHSFAIFPDGSKDGWADSDTGDKRRVEFVAWLESQRYEDRSSPYDWVEVQYGDDNGETRIVNDSDAWKRSQSQ